MSYHMQQTPKSTTSNEYLHRTEKIYFFVIIYTARFFIPNF